MGVGIAELRWLCGAGQGQPCDTHMLALFCALLTAMGAAAEHLECTKCEVVGLLDI